ncbi:MAG: Do family serine endopeptidase [Bacteroidetes bacterium]|nr:Do family serine endopeptidase [Bacteroidota bacterium]
MKKFGGYLVVAFLASLISLGTFAILQRKSSGQLGIPQQSLPVHLASMSGAPNGLPDFTTAANMSIHAVVHIKTEYARKNNYYDYFFNFHDFFGDNGNREAEPLQGAGSGVIISPDGYIVTNNHVVQDATSIEVVLNDKRSYIGTVVGTDPSTDLAVLRIDEKGLPFLSYGNSDDLLIGEWVLAVGNPFNLTSTVTAGIVSAKARNINILGTESNIPNNSAIESFIQTDAAVNRGNSGGALVNTRGELVGINAAIASGNGFYAGYSFAIPVNIVKKVVADLLDYGEVQRAFLGVNIQEIDSKFAEQKGLKELKGVYVADVIEEGAAQKAGIEKGDIITSIEGNQVNSTSELLENVSRYRPGDKINVTVSRAGSDKNFNVMLRNKEGNTQVVKKEDNDIVNLLGAEFAQASPELLNRLGVKNGVQVSGLSNGILRDAGIREGYVITEIDKKPVRTVDDIQNALANKRGGVLIEGIYPNRTRAYYGFGL